MCTQNKPTAAAAEEGHLAVLQYATRNGCQAQLFWWACCSAARSHCLRQLHRCPHLVTTLPSCPLKHNDSVGARVGPSLQCGYLG